MTGLDIMETSLRPLISLTEVSAPQVSGVLILSRRRRAKNSVFECYQRGIGAGGAENFDFLRFMRGKTGDSGFCHLPSK